VSLLLGMNVPFMILYKVYVLSVYSKSKMAEPQDKVGSWPHYILSMYSKSLHSK